MFSDTNSLAGDLCATAISGGVALSFLRLWEETAKRGLFDQVSCNFPFFFFCIFAVGGMFWCLGLVCFVCGNR